MRTQRRIPGLRGFFGPLPYIACSNSKAVGQGSNRRLCLVPIGVAWAHGIGGCRTDLPEQSSHGPARVKYTPRTTVLEATPASYLSMARERIEFGDMAPTRAA